MPTPQHVIEQSRAAEAELARIQSGATGEVPPAPAPVNDDPRGADDRFGVQQQVTELPPQGDQPPAPGPQSGPIGAEQFAELQQQLHTLQGRFNSQQNDLREQRARNEMLERFISMGQQRDPQPATPPAPAPAPPVELTTVAEREEFGADLTGMIERVAAQSIAQALRPIVDQLGTVQHHITQLHQQTGSVAQTVSYNAEREFNERMNRLVKDASGNPDWDDINIMHESRGDRRFVDWLSRKGHDSDETRQAVLVRAYQRKDAETCAGFFNRFKAELGLPDGNAAIETPATPPAPNPAASMVSPSPTAAVQPSTNRGRPRMIPLSEIEQHYADKTKGKWKNRQSEWDAKAKEYDIAYKESRIDPAK